MPEEKSKSDVKKAIITDNKSSALDQFEGKASGDQGVYLQPVGTQDDNPFSPPEQTTTQTTTSDTSVSPKDGGDSSQSE